MSHQVPAKPLRTWRPMAAWTAGILLALGPAWFVLGVAVPTLQVSSAVKRIINEGGNPSKEAKALGGPTKAATKCNLYIRRCPEWMATDFEKEQAYKILFDCGSAGLRTLISLLRTSDAGVREQTARVMDHNTCMALAFSCAEWNDPHGSEALAEALKESDWRVRRMAAKALGYPMYNPRAVDLLIPALKDSSPEVRHAVAEALWGFRDPRAIGPLKELEADPDADVRSAAASALKRIRGEEPGK